MRRLLLLLVLAWAPAAQAQPVVGIGDQQPQMFTSPLFQALDVPISRLIVSYDAVLLGTFEVAYVDAWVSEAAKAGVEPLIAFNHSRGCYDGQGISRRALCRTPTMRRYRRAVRAFRARYPQLRAFQPWNEVNHHSQPTARRPRLAARMYDYLRGSCDGCTVVAADVLDSANMVAYLRAFRRHTRYRPRLWGLHNYGDVGNRRRRNTRTVLRTVPGRLWLTETGGLVKFADKRPYDPRRAARDTAFLFRLMRMSPRIERVYLYQWTAPRRGARFDAALTHRDGSARPAYRVVLKHLAR